VDFGAVTSLVGAMGTRIGAEGYTAPEQEAGQPCVASDLFSVGATLLFLLSRQGPFSFYSGPMGTGRLCLEGLAMLQPKLSILLQRLLSEKVSDRPSSALELKLALTACLDEY
jgi:serine/threonine protein kinase, bacterial